MRSKFIVAILMLLILGGMTGSAQAQTRSVVWERWDVVINNIDTTNNSFDVSEQYDIQFTGTFEFGSRVIPMERLERIENIRVSQNGAPLRIGSCVSNAAAGRGSYCVTNVAEGLSITYYFNQPITNGRAQFEISYTVVGALRLYEGGDQLWWTAVTEEKFGFPVQSSTITVEMPRDAIPREGVDPIFTYGAPAEVNLIGTTVTAVATNGVTPDQAFEIRVQYPHNPEARKPVWQDAYDEDVEFDETIRPIINIGSVVFSLFLAITGFLAVFTHYNNRGRDPKVGPVPQYLSEPPSDLRPAVVGTLLDEKADTQDVLSTIVDLAQRGYIVIEETRTDGFFGIGGSSKHTFKRTDKPLDDLKKYEKTVMSRVFTGKLERTLESLKNKFYQYMQGLQNDLYEEIVREGLFTRSPNTTRSIYTGAGLVTGGAAFAVGILIGNTMGETSPVLFCIPVSLGFVALSVMLVGQFMPAKTEKGALEAAKWKAFREYLQNLDKYADVEGVADQFDRYLPYAVCFGLDRMWIRRFSKVSTISMPTWYYPTYRGGRYSRGYTAGTPLSRGFPMATPSASDMLPGEIARAGGGGMGLDSMSDSLSDGLNSISDGLTNMLNSASSTLTSRPSNSGKWSGGGGGFSGGGSSGGSSGGGSSGFG